MANNRLIITPTPIFPGEFMGTVNKAAAGRAYVQALRDEFRAVFSDPRFKVSDISEWPGASSAIGLGFIVRDTDPSVAAEWFFGFRIDTTNVNSYIPQVVGNNSTSTAGIYIKELSGTSVNNIAWATDCRPWIWLNKSYATHTFAMGFNNTTDLLYTLGDFQAPAASPYSNIATFMPNGNAGRHPGIWAGAIGSNNTVYNRYEFMYDHAIGFLRADFVASNTISQKFPFYMGKLYRSFADGGVIDPDDTEYFGMSCPLLDGSNTQSMPGASLASYPLRSFYTRANGTTVETNGAQVNTLSPPFNRNTYTDPSTGEVLINPILIGTGSHTKGYIDSRIICEAYPYNDSGSWFKRLNYPDADNPMVREHAYYCLAGFKDLPPVEHRPQAGLLLPQVV